MHPPRLKSRLGQRGFILATLLPGLIPIFLFFIYPLFFAVYESFMSFDILNPQQHNFVGFTNFSKVVGSYYFFSAVRATVIFVVISFVMVMLISLSTALLMSQTFKGVKLLQIIVLLPWAIPYVVSGGMWKWIYDANYGILNATLLKLGIISAYQPWLVHPLPAMLALVLSYVWSEAPLPTLIILAGLQSVPQELYDASLVDGAGALTRFRRITFNWLRPIFLIVFIWETITAIRTFDVVWVVTAGGPADFTATLSFFTWKQAFMLMDFGRALALCLIIVAVSLFLVYAYFKALEVRG